MPLSRLIILIIAVHHKPNILREGKSELVEHIHNAHPLDRNELNAFWKNLLNLN